MKKLRKLTDKVSCCVNWAEDAALALMFGVMMVFSVYQILQRNALGGGGPAWTEELLRILVLGLALIGSTAASRNANHIQIDLLTRYLPRRFCLAAQAVTMLFTSAICGAIAWYSWRFLQGEKQAGSVLLGNLPAWTVQLILPIGFGLIAVRYFFHFVNAAQGKDQSFHKGESV